MRGDGMWNGYGTGDGYRYVEPTVIVVRDYRAAEAAGAMTVGVVLLALFAWLWLLGLVYATYRGRPAPAGLRFRSLWARLP